MGKGVKPAKAFKTRDEAIRNALTIFPEASLFQRYVESDESRNGMPLSSETEQRLHLEEVRFPRVDEDASPTMPHADPDGELIIQEAEELLIGAEGAAFYSWHRRRERNLRLRKKVLELKGRECEICRMTFRAIYGASVSEFAEVHHLRSISEGERVSTIDDFAVLCANCHRAIHYKSIEPRSLQDVRNMMGRTG
jgi:predicted HNH restriction endonuclease